MSSTSPYTCITCHVVFQTGDLQRTHYKTDWHRYNLKRKVADLGPISATEFAEKVEAVQQRTDQINEKDQRSSLMCKDCGKAFTSENGLLNHIKSRKHAETVTKNAQNDSKKTRQIVESPKENPTEPMDEVEVEEEVEDDDDDDDDWNDMDDGATVTRNKMIILRKQKNFNFESILDATGVEGQTEVLGTPLSLEECLFCSLKSSNLEENLSHMAHAHSFFLPDFEYISNLPGLIEYLGKIFYHFENFENAKFLFVFQDEKVGIFHVCLWCNKRSFHDVLSVQRHMTAKGHCKILFDENPNAAWEYVDFYDYSFVSTLKIEIDESFVHFSVQHILIKPMKISTMISKKIFSIRPVTN